MNTLYKDVVAAGIPFSNHESDLYIPATPETRALIRKYGMTTNGTFINQVEGGQWFDVPFAFDPWWEKRE